MIQSKKQEQGYSLRGSCLKELQLLTGTMSKDLSYLYYLLVKDGTYFQKKEVQIEEINDECTVPSFADWFESL